MYRIMRIARVLVLVPPVLALPASATPQDYCAAYAQDFADIAGRGTPLWQQRFDAASADCLKQLAPAATPAPAPAKKQQLKPVKAKALAKTPPPPKPDLAKVAEPDPEPLPVSLPVIVQPDVPPPVADAPIKKRRTLMDLFRKNASEPDNSTITATNPPATPAPVAAAPGVKPVLEPGSAAWLDYCTNKYASFNRETGTYTSFSGQERKCLVTAN